MSLAKLSYPPGTKFTEWFIARELGSFWVKRMVLWPNGKRSAQRARRQDYSTYLVDSDKPTRALEDYVIRLNGRDPKAERLREQVRYNHAWINDEFLQTYREEVLYQSMQDRTNANALFQYLNRYSLNWFLNRKKVYTVALWKHHEREWGKYLLNLEQDQDSMVDDLRLFRDADEDSCLTPASRQLSAKVLKYTLYEMNRFIKYVYERRRSEFGDGLVQLEPWGKNFLEGYAANWRVKNQPRGSKYIRPDHWEVIAQTMKARDLAWRHQVHLAHDYGLRRCETMGLESTSVQTSHLHLLQQLHRAEGTVRYFRALKGREAERKIPHWFSEPLIARARIKAMLAAPMPHKDTISEGFQALCRGLKDASGRPLPEYIFHDLRRTFITNAVKKEIKIEDLRLATGHKDPQVLIKYYLMDSRDLESELLMDSDELIEV